eukprot:maker-scaffold91_size383040-snap-gene-1.24 protein:Tk03181 transcript:maker-scaffold91_size383040-snap-gene-1.24-mRNA-1 annotation:"hypothetical protein DAPPUDRAFT_332854"
MSASTNAAKLPPVATSRTTITTSSGLQLQQPGIAIQLLTAGSAACVADLFTFPLDTAKVRLQVQGEVSSSVTSIARPRYSGVIGTISTIAKHEGMSSLYNGIVPGLQRQMAFSAIRIGAYERVKRFIQDTTGLDSGIGFLFVRIAAGSATGTMAILTAQPTDVVKVRMQAEVRAPGQKSKYRGVMDAYTTIGRKEGIKGLYKGTLPNIGRTAIINVGEIVVYDIVKDHLIFSGWMVDGIPCHFMAAIAAGFTATLIASPVDVIKTRFMNSRDGKYRGAFHCGIETARNEGFKAFYKGFSVSFTRLVCWNICLWITYEQFKKVVLNAYN